MDTRPVDYIRHRMTRLWDALERTREHFWDPAVSAGYPASAPYYEKYGILTLLESLPDGSCSYDEIWEEFRQAEEKLRCLERDLGSPYRQKLRDELSFRVDIYAAAVCHANLGMARSEGDHDLFRRHQIAVLVRELERDHDLADVKTLLSILDENLSPAQRATGATLPDIPFPTTCTQHFWKVKDRIGN